MACDGSFQRRLTNSEAVTELFPSQRSAELKSYLNQPHVNFLAAFEGDLLNLLKNFFLAGTLRPTFVKVQMFIAQSKFSESCSFDDNKLIETCSNR